MKNRIDRSLAIKLLMLYENNDIYLTKDNRYSELKSVLLQDEYIELSDIAEFVDMTKKSNYTNFIYDINKKILISKLFNKNEVLTDIKFSKLQYIKFNEFDKKRCDQVLDIIINTKCKGLILDLRENIGGIVRECYRIMDILVPNQQLLKLYRKNEEINHSSEGIYRQFERIYVLLSEQSASCSEMLSMVLKLKKKNVFLLGKKQEFKECTQLTIYNRKLNYKLCIADSIWKVDSAGASDLKYYLLKDNILDVSYNKFDDYMKSILELEKINNYVN